LLLAPLVSGVVISDTTLFSSVSNSTIFVDRVVLDNLTVNGSESIFFNVSERGSNLSNVNDTSFARAQFFGLPLGFTLRNVNSSTDLFTSVVGSRDFLAVFVPGVTVRVLGGPTLSDSDLICLNGLLGLQSLSDFIPLLFVVVAFLIIVGLLGLLLFSSGGVGFDSVVSDSVGFDTSSLNFPVLFVGLVVFGVVVAVGLRVLSVLCSTL